MKQAQRRPSMLDQTKNKSSLLEFKTAAADAVHFKQTQTHSLPSLMANFLSRKGV